MICFLKFVFMVKFYILRARPLNTPYKHAPTCSFFPLNTKIFFLARRGLLTWKSHYACDVHENKQDITLTTFPYGFFFINILKTKCMSIRTCSTARFVITWRRFWWATDRGIDRSSDVSRLPSKLRKTINQMAAWACASRRIFCWHSGLRRLSI